MKIHWKVDMEIIGISGFKGSGKNFVGEYFEQQGYTQMAFADSIKDIMSIMFGWDRSMLDGRTSESREWRETTDVWWSEKLQIHEFSPRKAMQLVGTDALRNVLSYTIWTDIIERRMEQYEKVVITDCRFINELEMIRYAGGKTIKVTRHIPKWVESYNTGVTPKVHISEWEWLRWSFDYHIDNSNTKDQTIKILEAEFG